MKQYSLSDPECFSLLGAVEFRLRELEHIVEDTKDEEIRNAAQYEITNLHRVLTELEFE